LFIVLCSFTPFPFDLIGIVAGLIRYDVYKFFVGAWIGKVLRYCCIAVVGILGIESLIFVRAFFGF